MTVSVRRQLVALLLVFAILCPTRAARADTIKNEVIATVVGIVVVTAVVTTVVVLAIKHQPSITGCVASGPDGLQLTGEADRTTYLLTGDTADLKVGDRVKVSGPKKKNHDLVATHRFFVEKLKKDYGSCKAGA